MLSAVPGGQRVPHKCEPICYCVYGSQSNINYSNLYSGAKNANLQYFARTLEIHFYSIRNGSLPSTQQQKEYMQRAVRPFSLTPFLLQETQRGHLMHCSSCSPPCPLLEKGNSSLFQVRETECPLCGWPQWKVLQTQSQASISPSPHRVRASTSNRGSPPATGETMEGKKQLLCSGGC